MVIDNLKLLNFRNYTDVETSFNKQVNIFIGRNGQGKTNLLEAIQLLCTGESFRPSNNSDFINFSHGPLDHSFLKAKVQIRNTVKTLTQKHYRTKKECFVDDKKVSTAVLKKYFHNVVFSPDSLAIVKQGPSERRQLLDSILVSLEPSLSSLIWDFQKCLKTRNKVLKDYCEGRQNERETRQLLDSINPIFIPLAAQYTFARTEAVKTIILRVQNTLKTLLQENSVDISVDYVISGQSAIDWSENQVYDALYSRLTGLQAAELASGQSLVGPQKHDVRFVFNGQDARFFCSQGQQRAIVLAFKIAQIFAYFEKQNEYPVLLLDDVFSELDVFKRESLLQTLSQIQAQIFLTTTELETNNIFTKKDKTVFRVEKGNLTPGWN